MSEIEQNNWHEANQRYLNAALARVSFAVQRLTSQSEDRDAIEVL